MINPFNRNMFYDYISSFFSMVDQATSDMMDSLWSSIHIAGEAITVKAKRLVLSIAPQLSLTNVVDDYYDVNINILNAMPIPLDPTNSQSNYIIKPKKIIKRSTSTAGTIEVYDDLIELSADSYEDIRDTCIGSYVVILSKDSSRYFKIANTLSSTETSPEDLDPGEINRYLNPIRPGEDIYAIKLDNIDLSYIIDNEFSIYITTARAYKVDKNIIRLPELRTQITDSSGTDGLILQDGVDYTLNNGILEFNKQVSSLVDIRKIQYLYCVEAEMIEANIFDMYGTLMHIPNGSRYVNNNTSGRALISGLLKSVQNSSTIRDYNRALNLYYGLPIAPSNGSVLGLYESYGYEVDSIIDNKVTVLSSGNTLSKLIQKDGYFLIDRDSTSVKILDVNYDTKVISIDNISNINIGDKLYVKLPNRFKLKNANHDKMYLESNTNKYANGMINHTIDMLSNINAGELYEILVTGSQDYINNYNNIYHITKSEISSDGNLRFNVYNPDSEPDPRYNDYIEDVDDGSDTDITLGSIHMPWPTHKFLLIKQSDKSIFRAYMDSSIDTLYDTGDSIDQYDVICRNTTAMNGASFNGWPEFNKFKRYNNIDTESNILELTAPIRGAGAREYLPSEYTQG